MSNGNKQSWNEGAAKYSQYHHSEKAMARLLENPASAFHHTVWELIQRTLSDLKDKKICVPSSGDNIAVFAFAMLGAQVTSCDIAENQLANAQKVSQQYDWGGSITFSCQDTMKMEGIPDDTYDFVYTSNGVHVWIDDLPGMYRNIHRILKEDGLYIMYEIHPFQRPFDDDATIKKPYDSTGPFQNGLETTFGWRMMDIMNAMLDSGLSLRHIEEMFAEKKYDWPFWISMNDIMNGATASREEVDRMHDWRHNPMAALPNWLSLVAQKR